MLPLLTMAALAFAAALVVRRTEAFHCRWRPTRHTWVAVGTGGAAFLLSALLLAVPRGTVPGRLINFVLIWAGCGFAVPWAYTLLVERGSPEDMGLTRRRLGWSLALNVGLGALLAAQMFAQGDPGAIDSGVFVRAASVLLVGNLFELFLYYGFIHLRLEKAFGVIPAILVTSFIYMLWHAGTQLPLESDPLAAAGKLLLVGVMYQSVFSIARNLLAIWPFFVGAGVLLDFVVNVEAMEPMSHLFPWAVLTVVLMAVSGLALAAAYGRRSTEPTMP